MAVPYAHQEGGEKKRKESKRKSVHQIPVKVMLFYFKLFAILSLERLIKIFNYQLNTLEILCIVLFRRKFTSVASNFLVIILFSCFPFESFKLSSRTRTIYSIIAILAAIITISYSSSKMSQDNSEQYPLFQNDPNIDDSIQITFPNGKHVPLTKINKPHAVVHPTHQQPVTSTDISEPLKEHQQEGKKESKDDVYVYFPNGKSVPLSRLTKPHAVVHPSTHPHPAPSDSTDTSGGLLRTSDHRPGSN